MFMGAIGWIMLALMAGYIATLLVNKRGEGLPMDILLGIVGAMIGAWLFNAFGDAGMTGLNVWSLLVAMVGAGMLLLVWHTIRRMAWHA
jgi:uncharacterized membrane protein YeaQ/YmgE (transglycosylase-associated protein family)